MNENKNNYKHNNNNSFSIVKIAVFYDGTYFNRVSNFYKKQHKIKSRLTFSGLHAFICQQISTLENTDIKRCKVIDAHYFRGRLDVHHITQNGSNLLFNERQFDDILMKENVTSHYLPLAKNTNESSSISCSEKGIDVWLALEAFELTLYKKFDVVVLIAGDGDYIPLVRKLNTLGTRVMILGWDLENKNKQFFNIRTSKILLKESTYPIIMDKIIEENYDDEIIKNIFLQVNNRNEKEKTDENDDNDQIDFFFDDKHETY